LLPSLELDGGRKLKKKREGKKRDRRLMAIGLRRKKPRLSCIRVKQRRKSGMDLPASGREGRGGGATTKRGRERSRKERTSEDSKHWTRVVHLMTEEKEGGGGAILTMLCSTPKDNGGHTSYSL